MCVVVGFNVQNFVVKNIGRLNFQKNLYRSNNQLYYNMILNQKHGYNEIMIMEKEVGNSIT